MPSFIEAGPAAGRPSVIAPMEILAPLKDIGKLSCPTQERGLNVFNYQRLESNKIRYWYAGKFMQWIPMYLDIEQGTLANESQAPPIKPVLIELKTVGNTGEWVMSCSYQAEIGSSIIKPETLKTELTIRAQLCTLNKTTAMVSCNK